MRKIYGVGINDYDEKVCINGKHIKSYLVWISMLGRCYSEKYQENHLTYKDIKVCDEWLSFSKFKEWFDANYPYHIEEQGISLNLDKDILSGESKIYSPETCVFIPKNINLFMSIKYSNNTSGYTGVYWDKDKRKWRAQINDFYSSKYKKIGRFKNIEDAKNAYIKARAIEAEKAKEYLRELGYNEDIVNKIK